MPTTNNNLSLYPYDHHVRVYQDQQWSALCASITFERIAIDTFQVFVNGLYVGFVEALIDEQGYASWAASDAKGNHVTIEVARIDAAAMLAWR
jgi:hypothetical protein